MTNKQISRWRKAHYHWLEAQVRKDGHQEKTYSGIMELMYAKEFIWLVPNDDNRIGDGLYLRGQFLEESEAPESLEPDMLGVCSVLEVLVGLSQRLAFQTSTSPESCAWELIENLQLHKFPDPLTRGKTKKVNDILDTLIWRTYSPDGFGGFFPLAWPREDQTKIEIWYQMHAYLEEIHPEY
jgi:hypothetical protein